MDELRELLDYQRFARNPRLQRQLDNVAGGFLYPHYYTTF